MNYEQMKLIALFGFCEGQLRKGPEGVWNDSEYRTNAAKLASVVKGVRVPEVSYTQMEKAAASLGSA